MLSAASMAQNTNCPVMVDDILELTQQQPQHQTGHGNGHPFLPGNKSKRSTAPGTHAGATSKFSQRHLLALHENELTNEETDSFESATSPNSLHELTTINTDTDTLPPFTNPRSEITEETVDLLDAIALASFDTHAFLQSDSQSSTPIDEPVNTATQPNATNESYPQVLYGANESQHYLNEGHFESLNRTVVLSLAQELILNSTEANFLPCPPQCSQGARSYATKNGTINYRASVVNDNHSPHIPVALQYDSNSLSAQQIDLTASTEMAKQRNLSEESDYPSTIGQANSWKFHALTDHSNITLPFDCADCSTTVTSAPTEKEMMALTKANYFPAELQDQVTTSQTIYYGDEMSGESELLDKQDSGKTNWTVLINTTNGYVLPVALTEDGNVPLTTAAPSHQQWNSAPNGSYFETTRNGANLHLPTTVNDTLSCAHSSAPLINSLVVQVSPLASESFFKHRATLPLNAHPRWGESDPMSNWLLHGNSKSNLRRAIYEHAHRKRTNSIEWSLIGYLTEKLTRQRRNQQRLLMNSLLVLLQNALDQDADEDKILAQVSVALQESSSVLLNGSLRSARSKATVSTNSETTSYQMYNSVGREPLFEGPTKTDTNNAEYVINLLQSKAKPVSGEILTSTTRKCMSTQKITLSSNWLPSLLTELTIPYLLMQCRLITFD